MLNPEIIKTMCHSLNACCLWIISIQYVGEWLSVGSRLAFSSVFSQQLTRVCPELHFCVDFSSNYSNKEQQLNALIDNTNRRWYPVVASSERPNLFRHLGTFLKKKYIYCFLKRWRGPWSILNVPQLCMWVGGVRLGGGVSPRGDNN